MTSRRRNALRHSALRRSALQGRALRSRALRRFAVVPAAVALFATGCGDDADEKVTLDDPSAEVTTTAPAGSEGSGSGSTAAPTTVDATGDSVPIWPADDVVLDDPLGAAAAFARQVVGMDDPLVANATMDGDDAATVELRARANAPVGMLELTRRPDGGWAVVSLTTANIGIDPPAPASDGMLTVTGRSTAFEGTIEMRVFDLAAEAPIASTFGMGGANGEMGPFELSADVSAATTGRGVVVMFTSSMEDGEEWEASAVGVDFG